MHINQQDVQISVIKLYFLIRSSTFVYLVGLYTYCKLMHGAYNVKLVLVFSVLT